MDRTHIIRKVKSLLEKQQSRGASQHEALTALTKANELMKKYMIESYEIEADELDKLILKQIHRKEFGYDMTAFYAYLALTFDCECFYTKTHIMFYGHETDVELCEYFYHVIINSAASEKKHYLNSEKATRLKRYGYHGRTIARDFLNGYLIAVNQKLTDLYKDKESFFKSKPGLILISKKQRVETGFKNLNFKIKIREIKEIELNNESGKEGYFSGCKINLNRGLEQNNDKVLQIED